MKKLNFKFTILILSLLIISLSFTACDGIDGIDDIADENR